MKKCTRHSIACGLRTAHRPAPQGLLQNGKSDLVKPPGACLASTVQIPISGRLYTEPAKDGRRAWDDSPNALAVSPVPLDIMVSGMAQESAYAQKCDSVRGFRRAACAELSQ